MAGPAAATGPGAALPRVRGRLPGGGPLLRRLWRQTHRSRKSMMKRISLLVVLLVFGLASPALADAPGNGVIRGQVINGTPGGASVANQAITLKTYLDKAPQATTA